MQKYHKGLAVETGVKPENILILDNGDVAALTKNSLRLAGKVQANDIYIDGSDITGIGSSVIRERKLLSEEGLLVVVFTINSDTKTLLNDPTVVSRGFIYMKGNEELTQNLAKQAKDVVLSELQKKIFQRTQC